MRYYEENNKIIIENLQLLKKAIKSQKLKNVGIDFDKVIENIEYNLNEIQEGANNIIESLLIDWANEKRNIFEIEKIANRYNLGFAFVGDGGVWDLIDNDIEKLKKRRKLKFDVEIDLEFNNIIILKDITKLLNY